MEITSNDLSFNLLRSTGYEPDVVLARNDVINSFKAFKLWHYLAVNEIRRRYRRTMIGPFWTSLSLGIFISIISVMLSLLWKIELKSFLPYFCSGFISWTMMSTIVNEGCGTFIVNSAFLKQLSIPYVIYACLITWRNFIIFCHHFVIFLLVMLYCHNPINANILYIVPGFIIIFITAVTLAILFGMICARYRDFKQVIESCLQLVMFVTPIMWQPDQLGRKGLMFTKLNPVYHYISLIRQPLLGYATSLNTWLVTSVCTTILLCITFILFSKKYRNIIFWL